MSPWAFRILVLDRDAYNKQTGCALIHEQLTAAQEANVPVESVE